MDIGLLSLNPNELVRGAINYTPTVEIRRNII